MKRRRLAAVVVGAIVVALAGTVAVGMVSYANPAFDRGTSATKLVVLQEAIGALCLVACGFAATQIPRLARGERSAAVWRAAVALALAALWFYAAVVQRSS